MTLTDGPHAPASEIRSNRMILDEEAMATGVALHVAVAERFVTRSPGWFERVN